MGNLCGGTGPSKKAQELEQVAGRVHEQKKQIALAEYEAARVEKAKADEEKRIKDEAEAVYQE